VGVFNLLSSLPTGTRMRRVSRGCASFAAHALALPLALPLALLRHAKLAGSSRY